MGGFTQLSLNDEFWVSTCALAVQESTAEWSALKCNQIISNSLILLSLTDAVIPIVFTLPGKKAQ